MKKIQCYAMTALMAAAGVLAGCGDKKPNDPDNPVTGDMKLVKSLVFSSGDGYTETTSFEYDSKNRVIKFKSESMDGRDSYSDELDFTYDDAKGTMTCVSEREDSWMEDDEEYTEKQVTTIVYTLKDGRATKGEATSKYYENGVYDPSYDDSYTWSMTYDAKGYLQKLTPGDSGPITYTWSGGDMTNVSETYADHIYQYNSSWSNNPKCNLDLNAVFYNDGELNIYPRIIGLLGERSEHMLSAAKITYDGETPDTTYDVTYDSEGFVTKIVATETYEGTSHTDTYTVTYK